MLPHITRRLWHFFQLATLAPQCLISHQFLSQSRMSSKYWLIQIRWYWYLFWYCSYSFDSCFANITINKNEQILSVKNKSLINMSIQRNIDISVNNNNNLPSTVAWKLMIGGILKTFSARKHFFKYKLFFDYFKVT